MTKSRLLIFLMALAALASCDKVYINGDLDGMWQLQRVETCDTTEYPQGIYYSFQRHMVQVGQYYSEGVPLRYLGELEYKKDSLTIGGFRKFLEEEKTATEDILATFYLYDKKSAFKIDRLDDEMLVLRSNRGLYTLRKW